MGPDLWVFDNPYAFGVSLRVGGYLAALTYSVLTAWAFLANLREWRNWTSTRWVALLIAVALGLAGSGLFLVSLPGAEILPLPRLPGILDAPYAPLFGAVAVLLVGGWMGIGPAILVGATSGVIHAFWITGRGAQVVEFALLAAIVSFLLRQNYRGRGFAWFRRPIVAGVAGGMAASLLAFPIMLASTRPDTPVLSAMDLARSLAWVSVLPNLLEWTVAGLIAELVFGRAPMLRPQPRQLTPPPYDFSITRRFLAVLLPGCLLVIVILVAAVTSIASGAARDLVLEQMVHDARVASDAIPEVIALGDRLLMQFAQDDTLVDGDREERRAQLEQFLLMDEQFRPTFFFRQLLLIDNHGQELIAYPPLDGGETASLVGEERAPADRAAQLGYPDKTRIWIGEYGVPVQTYIVPIRNANGEPVGALLGRVSLQVILDPIMRDLQGTIGTGRGFVVDDQGRIISHLDTARVLLPWAPLEEGVRTLDDELAYDDPGRVYERIGPIGTRQLVYYRTGPDHPWTVVVIVPFESVLSLATEVTGPLTIFLGASGLALALTLALLIRQVNQPLSALSKAAGAMAQRDLDTPVQIGGEDEVGRLGRSFEQMRRSLRGRLNELQLLLGVSQSVTASLNLPQGVPPILEGALEATGADGVRIVVVSDGDRGLLVFSKGELSPAMAPLDSAIDRLVQQKLARYRSDGAPPRYAQFRGNASGWPGGSTTVRKRPRRPVFPRETQPLAGGFLSWGEATLQLDNTARARAVLDTSRLADEVGAILALPLRTMQGYQGILWIACRQPHAFTEFETSFMTTLAGQASVLIENVQLFEAAEGGRRRLSAILASTGDAVIVTDQRARILLLNPAAEAAFGVLATQVMGQPASEVLPDPGLVDLLVAANGGSAGHEVELPDGRVLYASASPISSDDSQGMGSVAVLRDITHLKEVEEMKTEFVDTVSHDLRSPLTYMCGYATMLPMIGELSPKQKEYVGKILSSIDQMTRLIDDLLGLARIESDADLPVQPVQIGELVRAVANGHRTHAVSKGLSLNVDVADQLPAIMGDPTLLRQAFANLIDNAIRYTPVGEVTVRAHPGTGQVIIKVQDTGPGISQADQAHLFERFSRVKRRESLETKGAGLGLAIVKSIIERRHGGRVWVESRLGAGSSFFVTLPIGSRDGDIRVDSMP
jgi:PAS domain S-box-containing protein